MVAVGKRKLVSARRPPDLALSQAFWVKYWPGRSPHTDTMSARWGWAATSPWMAPLKSMATSLMTVRGPGSTRMVTARRALGSSGVSRICRCSVGEK